MWTNVGDHDFVNVDPMLCDGWDISNATWSKRQMPRMQPPNPRTPVEMKSRVQPTADKDDAPPTKDRKLQQINKTKFRRKVRAERSGVDLETNVRGRVHDDGEQRKGSV